ncbi:SDR family NAD(P)-dependent oxidoreductase, partial [Micromonospora sp. WMMD736]|uniref:SDR family NAD(P)-dependent oxidoreductase n=1 Tax=Micromonospora sp. WMMD736 TaxID=3404112 RepID=UPI003B939018
MTIQGVAGVRVVVTGSTRGLGLAVAKRLSNGGAHVVVNGTDEDRCRSVAQDLGTITVCGRVETSGVAEALVDTCVAEFGGIDVVVNNAGMTRDAMLTRMTRDDLREVLAAHIEGTWAVSQAAVRAMKSGGGGGAIVNVTSGTALFGNTGQSNYAAAKGGILGLTRSLSLELARFGIDVNAVAPTVKTDMTAGLAEVLTESGSEISSALGEPDSVATLFEYLCSTASRGMTGQVLSFDGNELSVWSHPCPTSSFDMADRGWNIV